MSRDLRATAILDARDNTGGAFASAQRKLAALEGRMKTFNAGQRTLERNSVATVDRRGAMLERARGVLVGGATALAGYGVGAYAAGAVKRFSEVERSMTRVGITGEATNEEIAGGIEKMRTLAMQTAQPFDKMREGMEALTSSGKSFQESLAMMPAIARTAQASGAGMAETANTSVALLNHMQIKTDQLQEAQDILAKAGKMGQFEAKDMARYFPSILPAANAAGFTGIDGLKHLAGIAQTIRMGTGTSEEAAGSIQNVLQKMEIEETAKKFKKFGIDLRKEMDGARKKGANLFDTFIDLTEKALKGDMSKLPQLFQDSEVLRGMRPLLNHRNKIGEFVSGMNDAGGTTNTDLDRILKNKQADIDRFSAAWDRFTTSIGKKIAGSSTGQAATAAMEHLSKLLEHPTNPNAPGEMTKRMAEHARLTDENNNRGGLESSVAESAKIEQEMRRLLDRGKNGMPLPLTRLRNLDALRKAAGQRGTDLANKFIPKPEGPDGFYDILPFGRADVPNARDLGYGFRPSGPLPPGGHYPIPPVRPNGSELFKDVPALDFGEAKASAEEAKTDIEAIMRGLDLTSQGQQAGSSMRTGLSGELRAAEAEADGWIARMKSKFSFTISPKVNVGLNQGVSTAGSE